MATIINDANITVPDVTEIKETNLTDAQVSAFINMAYYAILKIKGELGNCGGSNAFDEIHKLVTAHLITLREPQVSSEEIGDTSVEYLEPKQGTGLSATSYGQQAISMDCSGKLASSAKKQVTFDSITQSDF